MISDENSISSLSSLWAGDSYWSPALGRQGGVLVLISKNFDGQVISWQKDSDGRVLSLLVRYGNVNFNLVNIYAPTVITDRKYFFQSLHKYFFPHAKVIIGGDFNSYDNLRDKFGGNFNPCKELSDLKSCFNFVDAWRSKHPRVTHCTWFNANFSIGSRLDTFLISRDLLSKVSSCEIAPCGFSDHDFVSLNLDIADFCQNGPGVWKFNNSLLDDSVYCDTIRAVILQHINFKRVFLSEQDFWDSLKDSIKNCTIKFSKNKRRGLYQEKICITNRLIVLKNFLVNGDSSVTAEIEDLEAALNTLFTKELEGAKIRSRAKWLEEGESPSRYFFKLEKQKMEKNVMSSIYDANGVEVSDRADLMKAHEAFYANLYLSEFTDPAVQNELLSNVQHRLSDADRDFCEGELLLTEASNAVKNMNKNKSPSPMA